tara:strand:- start:39 stop:1121 length:1083 start_codon:yes stop_codon:yes gene_type:complete
MKIKTYKIYLLKKFSKKVFLTSLIFFTLVLIVNLLEEINFLKNNDSSFFLPFILSFLNAPSLMYEIFPFIFLIATQFFFIDIIESKEFFTFKQLGLSNLNLLNQILIISFSFGLIIVIIFYNFSSSLKKQYLLIKNSYSDDSKYLAVITKNGLWIRDIINEKITIINAEKIYDNFLINATITSFNKDFEIEKNITATKIDIKDFDWIIYNAQILDSDNNRYFLNKTNFYTNFNFDKINSLFSNLSSLSFFELLKLKKDYEFTGYSTNEVVVQLNKMYSFPFLLTVMTMISSLIMISIKFQKSIMIHLFVGIFLSVFIYYINNFFNLLGISNKIPLIMSVWFPIIILSTLSCIGLVRINEK